MTERRIEKMKLKKFVFWISVIIPVFVIGIFAFWPQQAAPVAAEKHITLLDNGLEFRIAGVVDETVGDFLRTHGLELGEKETVFPSEDTLMTSGMKLIIFRAHEVVIHVDGAKKTYPVRAVSVGEVLTEAGMVIDEDDIVSPKKEEAAFRGIEIVVTRVEVKEETIEKTVAFEKKTNEDKKLSWRKIVTTQKGVPGLDRLTYRVSSHDGKEVSRKLVKTERVKEPVAEVVTQGTHVELGKSHTGAASWYAWTGTMAAANPWLPKGSYVKVTNVENGKSVIVVINDRGPFVPGRIIDLDKVAFAKIASVGAGVINVKMEEIVN